MKVMGLVEELTLLLTLLEFCCSIQASDLGSDPYIHVCVDVPTHL